MEKGRHEQYGAATGILAVMLFLIGFSILGSDIPAADASPQNWLPFYSDHHDRIQTGLTIASVGLCFFLWFLGSLRDAIAGAEGRQPPGVGRPRRWPRRRVGLMIWLGAAPGWRYTPAGRPGRGRALSTTSASMVAAPVAAGFVAMFAATDRRVYRRGAFPPWVAGLSALAAIGQLFAFPTGADRTARWRPDGVFGLWVPFFTFAIAVLAISGSLVSRAGKGAAPEAQTQTAT